MQGREQGWHSPTGNAASPPNQALRPEPTGPGKHPWWHGCGERRVDKGLPREAWGRVGGATGMCTNTKGHTRTYEHRHRCISRPTDAGIYKDLRHTRRGIADIMNANRILLYTQRWLLASLAMTWESTEKLKENWIWRLENDVFEGKIKNYCLKALIGNIKIGKSCQNRYLTHYVSTL